MKRLAVILLLAGCSVANDPTTRPARDANEIRRGIVMSGDPEERGRQFYDRMIRKIEPSGHGDIKKLDQYLELFEREGVQDTRNVAFNVHGETRGGRGILKGYSEFAEQKDSLRQYFSYLHLPVEDQIELLPVASIGDLKLAVVTARHTFVCDKPEGRRENLTECVCGEIVFVLQREGKSLLVHAPNGYVGYIAADDVSPFTSAIPPTARTDHIEAMIASASKFMGTHYVWGGVTNEGIDCSGVVYSAFKSIGIAMPRDADQQFLVGRLVATRWHRSNLRRGDLLYFLGRRGTIHHTAIYLGDNKYLEATEPVVKITSFDPKDKEYNEKRDKSFCFGKRVIE
jgi:cell wall-associated NlpC family hydrolase